MRKPLVSVTAKDCRWAYYNGTGKGGSNRNKTQCCVKCFHDPSGAMGKSEDERSQVQNKRLAFKRMVATEEFKKWLWIETITADGTMAEIEKTVEREMNHILAEGLVGGRWEPLD